MAFYLYKWELLHLQTYPANNFKKVKTDTESFDFTPSNFPSASSYSIGNKINIADKTGMILDYKAVSYKTINDNVKTLNELVLEVSGTPDYVVIELVTSDELIKTYLLGEVIVAPPHDHTILTLCEPIITTTTSTTTTSSTTTTTTVP